MPVFCDVDESLHIDPRKIEAKITSRTVAMAPTCVMGGVPDLEPILAIARRHNLKVVEDCAQSPGAKYRGRPVGTWGDLGCFSISAYKIVGGGEGGLLLTNDERLFSGPTRWPSRAGCGGRTVLPSPAMPANCSAARTTACPTWRPPSTSSNCGNCPRWSRRTMPIAAPS